MKNLRTGGWIDRCVFFPLRALPSLTQFSDAIMDARLRKSLENMRARHRAHANWGVLFKLRCAFSLPKAFFFFFDDSGAAYALLCRVYRIYADDMQCDQIIPLFPIPSVLVEGDQSSPSPTDVLAPVPPGRLIHMLREKTLWI